MSLFSRIFSRRQTRRPTNQDLERRVTRDYFSQDDYVKFYYPEQSLKVAAAWRCVNIISNTLATLPWRVMTREEDGVSQARNHPLYDLLSVRPNPEHTPMSFRETLISHVLLYGNGYAEIVRDNTGRPQELWLLAPDRVEPTRDEVGNLVYRVSQAAGDMVYLNPDSMFHVPGLSFDGIRGYSVLDVADRTIGNSLRIDKFTSNYFQARDESIRGDHTRGGCTGH